MPNDINDAHWVQWMHNQLINDFAPQKPAVVQAVPDEVDNNVHPVPNGGGLIAQIDPFGAEVVKKYAYNKKYDYGYYTVANPKDAALNEERLKRQQESKIKIMNNFGITEKEVDLLLENRSIESVIIKLKSNRSNIFPTNIVVKPDDLNNNALLIGYIYDNKFYTNGHELYLDTFKEMYKMFPENDVHWKLHSEDALKNAFYAGSKGLAILKEVIKPVMVILDDKKPKLLTKCIYSNKFVYREVSTTNAIALITGILSIKVINSELSSKVYGNANKKAELVDKIITPGNYTITSTKSKKLENNNIFNFILGIEGGEGKFVLQDVEFVFPTLVGYNFPKDKSLNEGTVIKITKDISPILRRGTEGRIVRFVKIDENSKRLSRNSKTRQLDVISINVNGRLHKVYAKYLKSIC